MSSISKQKDGRETVVWERSKILY